MQVNFAKINYLLFAALVGISLLSYLFPVLSLPVLLLFMFLMPGLLLILVLKIDMNFNELLAYSILSSVLLSTHLIYCLSLILGYSAKTIFFSFNLVSLLVFFVDFKTIKRKEIKPVIDPAVICTLLVFIAVYFVMMNTLWVVKPTGQIITSGYNYGDFFVHLATMQTVNNGNFPPQVPDYAGEMLRYHWFVDFHTAIISKATAIFPPYVVQFESAVYTALLFLVSFLLGKALTNDNKTALICGFLVLLAGNFSYLAAGIDLEAGKGGGDFLSLIKQNNYSKDMSFYQIIAPMDYMLVQRPQTIGIPLVGAIIYLVITGYPSSWKRMFLAGLLIALLGPFQYFALAAAAILSVTYILYWHVSNSNFSIKFDSLLGFFLPILYAVPFAVSALGSVSGKNRELVKFWWIAEESLKNIGWGFNPFTFFVFYIANYGLMLFLAIPALFYKEIKHRAFLVLWIVFMFIIPNTLNLTTWQWDMCKFFVFAWFPLAILSASTIRRMNSILQAVAITACVAGPVLFIAWMLSSQAIGFDNNLVQIGEWVGANTPEKSMFITGTVHNSPVDSIGGRLRIMGYGGIIWTHGYDWFTRSNEVNDSYCGSNSQLVAVMDKYNVSYIYYGPFEKGEYKCTPAFLSNSDFEKVYQDKGVEIYRRK